MSTVILSDDTYAKAKAAAEPLVDDADSVISRALDLLLRHKGPLPNGNGRAPNRQDPVRLPVGTQELRHTRLLSATVDGTELHRSDWNSLMRDMHTMARQRLGSLDAVRQASPANLRRGRFEENGYRFLPEADFSIQGCDANKSCESAFRLAKALNIPLRVTFEWREKEDAAHPGQTGVIEWSPGNGAD